MTLQLGNNETVDIRLNLLTKRVFNSFEPDSKSRSKYFTDAELFAAIKRDDTEALGYIYDRYCRLVYGLAFKMLANQQEAEDLTQEIFLLLWRKHNYNPSRGSLRNFLAMMTRSRAIDRLRARQSNQKFLQRCQQNMTFQTTPFEQVSQGERRACVCDALRQLPSKQRQVLEMAYYQGYSQTEIARQLNTPLGTVKSWTRQGLLKLRKNLLNLME